RGLAPSHSAGGALRRGRSGGALRRGTSTSSAGTIRFGNRTTRTVVTTEPAFADAGRPVAAMTQLITTNSKPAPRNRVIEWRRGRMTNDIRKPKLLPSTGAIAAGR